MKKILVPSDFSSTAEKALQFAADLASRSGGEILLYHTYMPSKNPFIDTYEKRQQYNRDLLESLSARLEALRSNITGRYPTVRYQLNWVNTRFWLLLCNA